MEIIATMHSDLSYSVVLDTEAIELVTEVSNRLNTTSAKLISAMITSKLQLYKDIKPVYNQKEIVVMLETIFTI